MMSSLLCLALVQTMSSLLCLGEGDYSGRDIIGMGSVKSYCTIYDIVGVWKDYTIHDTVGVCYTQPTSDLGSQFDIACIPSFN